MISANELRLIDIAYPTDISSLTRRGRSRGSSNRASSCLFADASGAIGVRVPNETESKRIRGGFPDDGLAVQRKISNFIHGRLERICFGYIFDYSKMLKKKMLLETAECTVSCRKSDFNNFAVILDHCIKTFTCQEVN